MSGNERVLALLSDGRSHSHRELYDLRVVAHSRVADLRRRGFDITCVRVDGEYVYTLNPQLTLGIAA